MSNKNINELTKVEIFKVRKERYSKWRFSIGDGSHIVEIYETGEIFFCIGLTWRQDDVKLTKEQMKQAGQSDWKEFIRSYCSMYHKLLKSQC